jgi:hypothetical protein
VPAARYITDSVCRFRAVCTCLHAPVRMHAMHPPLPLACSPQGVLRHLKRPAAPKVRVSHLVQRAPALRRQLCLTCGPIFVTLAHGNARFPLQTPGQRPGGLKAISYRSVTVRKSVVPVDTEAVSTAGSLLFKCGLSMMGFRTAR